MSSSSLFASLGAAFHSFSFKSSSPLSSSSSSFSSSHHHSNPELAAFESDLACELDRLKPSDDAGCLSSAWLCEAMGVVLHAHAAVVAFVPDLQKALADGDTKWLDEYLDDSVKLLDICNALRETLLEIKSYQRCIDLALHSLSQSALGEAQLRRARNALSKCTVALKKRDDHVNHLGQYRSKLENCSSMLRRMGEKLNTEDASKGNFFMASYAAQVTTIFICGVLTSALSFKSRRPLSTVHASGQSAWSSSLINLQHRIKEHVDKKKAKGVVAVLKELEKTDSAACALRDYIDKVLNGKALPLAFNEKLECVKKLAGPLQACSENLREGLSPLECNIGDVFKVLISSRVALLEIYSHSR